MRNECEAGPRIIGKTLYCIHQGVAERLDELCRVQQSHGNKGPDGRKQKNE